MEKIQFIQVTPKELEDAILKRIEKQLSHLQKSFIPKQPNEYLTRTDVSELLSIHITTVHNLTKRGILTSYGIGKRIYYKRSEVEEAIVKI